MNPMRTRLARLMPNGEPRYIRQPAGALPAYLGGMPGAAPPRLARQPASRPLFLERFLERGGGGTRAYEVGLRKRR